MILHSPSMIHHLWRVAPVHASGLFMVKNLLDFFISSDALNNIAFLSENKQFLYFQNPQLKNSVSFCLSKWTTVGQLRNKCGFFLYEECDLNRGMQRLFSLKSLWFNLEKQILPTSRLLYNLRTAKKFYSCTILKAYLINSLRISEV